MIITLENWYVKADGDGFTAPELCNPYLGGVVASANPRHKVGEKITTSHLASSKGRVVTTKSGSQYRLGTPDDRYVDFCKSIGKAIDPKQPVKVIN